MRVGLLVPTLNAGSRWPAWIHALSIQTRQPDRVLVIDSASTDNTLTLARAAGYETHLISRTDFDHGGTRQLGVRLLQDCDIIVCLTQDALLDNEHALAALITAFTAPRVAVAYGRQLPHDEATPIAAHARHFNYPAIPKANRFEDRVQSGIRTAFCSNSFAAWRRSALLEIGGFAQGTLFGEDMQTCARLLMAGHTVIYAAHAQVRHSHNYRVIEEFRRYFDTGAMHTMTPWLIQAFGTPGGEGRRYVASEWRWLSSYGCRWKVRACASNAAKWFGYQLGRHYRWLPRAIRPRFSLHPGWWNKPGHQ
ncbi:glycosyltransferase family 2 protein [Chitinimonas sp. BJYL2]|uniref:glycosyltransferase family 2 protein n=1 Tax=Chitinimonas sp. BJYL2 TaxID=2976696 RepID=UPI0022B2FEEE|nr:glycosyltransferase [Chitinimonas sp. BJYL2]